MEKSSFISQSSDLSKSVSLYAKEAHIKGKALVTFCAPKIVWTCVTIFNILANLQKKIESFTSPFDNEIARVLTTSTLKEEAEGVEKLDLKNHSKKGPSISSFHEEVTRLNTTPILEERAEGVEKLDLKNHSKKAPSTPSFQQEVKRLNAIRSTVFEDKEAKGTSPEAPMLTFPVDKKSLEKAQMILKDSLTTYPPKTGQTTAHPRGTDTSLADFFLDKATIPGTNLSFWDIVQNRDSQPFLQENIDTIMPMLCPSLSPYPDSDTPLLSTRLLYLIQTDPAIASKYLLGVTTILHFFGLKISSAGRISARESYQACATYVREHKKQRQLYQLVNSLLACGFYDLGYNLRGILLDEDTRKDYGVSAKALRHLTKQAFCATIKVDRSNATAYWKACAKKLALKDGIAFDQTVPPKTWASYQAHFWHADPVYSEFKKGSPPLLVRKMKKGRWYWHLPHLQTPFSNTKKEPKKQKAN